MRLQTIELLEKMLAADLIPVVPSRGSVGASGDLAPLAHMTATMIGEGEAFLDGARMPSAAALKKAGLTPRPALITLSGFFIFLSCVSS